MKHKCIVKIDDELYSQIVFISNFMGVSVPDFLSQIIDTKEFQQTITTIFENLSKEAVKKALKQYMTNDSKPI